LNHKGHEVHKGFLKGSIENLKFRRTIVGKNFRVNLWLKIDFEKALTSPKVFLALP
jgi:hypothetical protein